MWRSGCPCTGWLWAVCRQSPPKGLVLWAQERSWRRRCIAPMYQHVDIASQQCAVWKEHVGPFGLLPAGTARTLRCASRSAMLLHKVLAVAQFFNGATQAQLYDWPDCSAAPSSGACGPRTRHRGCSDQPKPAPHCEISQPSIRTCLKVAEQPLALLLAKTAANPRVRLLRPLSAASAA